MNLSSTWTYQSAPDLTDEQFQRWQDLLESRTGINFAQHKSILQSGLLRRMREVDCDSYEDYYRTILSVRQGAVEWTALMNTLTVGETSFFRQPEAYEFLRKYLVSRLSQNHQGKPRLELWSAGCSSGEEAYSLAMIANDCIEGLGVDAYYGVIGSDLSLSALAEARRGEYKVRRLALMNESIKRRYFTIDQDNTEVAAWLKKRVGFFQANLTAMDNVPIDNMDVVFCQNVLIYFRKEVRHKVLSELVNRLKPGGLLIAGLGETSGWSDARVVRTADERIQAYIKQAN